MKIKPLAFDSLGVRSTATFVETDQKITIDPAAALGPKRYRLPPAQIEIDRLLELSKIINEHAVKSDILTISHYHYDHYSPDVDFHENFYKDKILLVKNPHENINKSQAKRAREFLEKICDTPAKIEFADDRTFKFKKTEIKFSPAVYHGSKNSKLGFVLMCSSSYPLEKQENAMAIREKVIHASDIQGPQVGETRDWIIAENPDTLILSGFPTLFLGWRFPKSGLEKSNQNLIRIMEETKVKKIILDHHLVRDLHYKNKITPVLERAGELGREIITAAEFRGMEPEFLEARRKEFFRNS